MTKYSLNIHHRDAKIVKDKADNYQIERSPVGHFYISLQEENKEPIFFGKYPKEDNWLNSLFGPGKIVSDREQKTHKELIEEDKDLDTKHVYTRTVTLNDREYHKALDFAKASSNGNIGDNFYFIGASDCRHFVQDVWIATGRYLPFTVIFSTDEMKQLNTVAANNLLFKFGSRDIIANKALIVEDISKDNIARKFNLALDNIQEIDALNNPPAHIACYEGIQLTKFFKIIVNPEVINHALVGVSEVNINNTIDSVTTAASDTINVHNDTTLFKFEIVHDKCKISEDSIEGETKELLLSVGPFFVRLKANDQVMNIGQCSKDSNIFFGKTSLSPATANSIIDHFKGSQEVTDGSVYIKTLNLTKEQYNKILQYIESGIKYGDTKVLQSHTSTNETSNNVEQHYVVRADDSASLVQNLYHATGLPLYFTAAYSKPELVNLESVDAKKALEAYSSRDDIIKKLNSIYGDSKEEVAKMLNIDPEQVGRASKLKGCVPACRAVEGTKFRVKIDQEMLDSITSIIDVSDNKSIQTRDVLDINNMCKELNELFLRFKIPPEISQDDSSSKPSTSSVKSDNEFANQDSNYGNFQKLKDYIKEEMSKDKGKLDELLQKIDKQEQSTSSGGHYTEQELISIFHKQIEVLQKEFKNTQEYYKKNPGQYKYEPGEKLPGMAAFNRGEAKLSQWLSEEFSKIKGIAINIPVSQRNTSQEIKEKIVQDWNKTIDSLREKTAFNDKVNESINKIDQTVAIITHDMELLLQGEESIIAQGIFC